MNFLSCGVWQWHKKNMKGGGAKRPPAPNRVNVNKLNQESESGIVPSNLGVEEMTSDGTRIISDDLDTFFIVRYISVRSDI